VQTRGRTTLLLPAEHRDGAVKLLGEPITFEGLEKIEPAPVHVYDPRLTVIDDEFFVVCACDFADGTRLLTARSHDFKRWELIALDEGASRRNGVLFPQRFDGAYLRLERPNQGAAAGEPASGDRIVVARSEDLIAWSEVGELMRGRPQLWDERIGSGPPPIKTREGWLHIYHGVATHFASVNVYQAGVVLLDLDDPSQVLARGAFNVLEPRESWELSGQVPNVVFPSGMTVENRDDDGFALAASRVHVYYGAADTVVGLAECTIAELIEDARFAG